MNRPPSQPPAPRTACPAAARPPSPRPSPPIGGEGERRARLPLLRGGEGRGEEAAAERRRQPHAASLRVIAGLDPAIKPQPRTRRSWRPIPGSSPGMTSTGMRRIPDARLVPFASLPRPPAGREDRRDCRDGETPPVAAFAKLSCHPRTRSGGPAATPRGSTAALDSRIKSGNDIDGGAADTIGLSASRPRPLAGNRRDCRDGETPPVAAFAKRSCHPRTRSGGPASPVRPCTGTEFRRKTKRD